jgi:hypothetical protein
LIWKKKTRKKSPRTPKEREDPPLELGEDPLEERDLNRQQLRCLAVGPQGFLQSVGNKNLFL